MNSKVAEHRSPWGGWKGSRYSHAECVSTRGVTRGGVPTHQRWLSLLYLHRSLVQFRCLLKVALLVAIWQVIKVRTPNICNRSFFLFSFFPSSYRTLEQPDSLGSLQPVGVNAPNCPRRL